MWYISISYQLEWEKKFIIPQSLLDYVEEEVNQFRNKAINEPLPIRLFEESPNIDNPDNHPLVLFFNWLNDNCITETDTRKLDITNLRNDDFVFDCIMESRLLANKVNRILVSEDTFINDKLSKVCPTLSCDAVMRVMNPELNEKISKKLFDFNYVGITIYSDTILKEFKAYLNQADNKFDLCLQNLKHNILNWRYFADAAAELCAGVYTRNKQRQTTNLILSMFETLGTTNAMKICYLMYNNSSNSAFKTCLTDAFSVYTSTHVCI